MIDSGMQCVLPLRVPESKSRWSADTSHHNVELLQLRESELARCFMLTNKEIWFFDRDEGSQQQGRSTSSLDDSRLIDTRLAARSR